MASQKFIIAAKNRFILSNINKRRVSGLRFRRVHDFVIISFNAILKFRLSVFENTVFFFPTAEIAQVF